MLSIVSNWTEVIFFFEKDKSFYKWCIFKAAQFKCSSLRPIIHGPVILSYLGDCWIYEGHTWDIGSTWLKDWPHKIHVGHWPLFHGPMILLSIFKIIWWMKILLGIMDKCETKIWLHKMYLGQWPIFCSPVSLLNILKTIWWSSYTWDNGSVW